MSEQALVHKSVSKLAANKPLRYHINALTKFGRKQLMQVLIEFFESQGLNKIHVFPIHYAIVEIVFNALKANVKFVAFREEIRRQLSRFKIMEIEDLLQVIIEERTLREFMASRVMPNVLRHQVHKIFDLEDKYRVGIKEKLTQDQIELLKQFRHLIRQIDAAVNLKIEASDTEIKVNVKNNVPILERDLQRIQESRRKHFDLHMQGRAGDFFDYEHMDVTESAGFGIAMVDQGFFKLGLDPFQHLTIDAHKRTTEVTLVYPRRVLRI